LDNATRVRTAAANSNGARAVHPTPHPQALSRGIVSDHLLEQSTRLHSRENIVRKMSYFIDAEILGLAGKTQPTRISFDRHINILYGLNGSGKTSLLKILHSAMAGDAEPLKNVPFRRATIRLFSESYETVYTRTINKETATDTAPSRQKSTKLLAGSLRRASEKSELGWTETVRAYDDLADTKPGSLEGKLAAFQHQYLPTTRLYVNQPKVHRSFEWTTYLTAPAIVSPALTEETLDKNFAEALERLWADYTSEIGRSVRDAQAKGLANILKSVMSGARPRTLKKPKLNLERAYDSVKQFLVRQGSPDVLGNFASFSQRYETDASLQAIVDDIYSVEQEVDTAAEPQKRLEALIHRLYSGNKKVIFSETSILVETNSGERIGLESLSSGEKQLIRMFVECLSGGPNSILIDEPEISVHIDWQRELMAILQSLNPEAQFIVATHSPEIMAEIPDERLFRL
jgi:predicted ATPase